MSTQQKRQTKVSSKSVKAQYQVVDVTPLNSTRNSQTPSKVNSFANVNASKSSKTPSKK